MKMMIHVFLTHRQIGQTEAFSESIVLVPAGHSDESSECDFGSKFSAISGGKRAKIAKILYMNFLEENLR